MVKRRGCSICCVLCAAFAIVAAFCFCDVASPVRAEGAQKASASIPINKDTATVTVNLFADEYHNKPLDGAVTSATHLYGAFSAHFLHGKAPSVGNEVAVYYFPDTIVVDDNVGGDLIEGSGADAVKAGTWKIENNKAIFTFNESWLKDNPADIYVAANFSFELANKDTGSGGSAIVGFPGAGSIKIDTKDGNVTGAKSGAFSQSADGVAKVTWTVTLGVESYATNVKFADMLGDNFSFVDGSFTLDGKKLDPQPTIDGQIATLDNLGSLSQGNHTITYETVLKSGVSVNNGEYIDKQEASKNTATWEWGGAGDRQNGTVTAAPGKFRYDMIAKSNGSGTPSDITWTVTLNRGELKADMSGYKFTDTLDAKQTYIGSYTVYKGSSGSEVLATGMLDTSQSSFTYTFPTELADKYATYRIVYHTKMNDTSSYDTVRNYATIEREGSVSGSGEGKFTPQLVGTPITKRLVSSDEAATTGRATWETRVALKAIVDAVHPDKVTVKDTFQTAWSQNIGVDVDSITIKIGETVLVRGQNADWKLTDNYAVGGTKRNFNLDIYVNDKVKAALENEDYAVITYATTSDALPGWYSNFASVSVNGKAYLTNPIYYYLDQETTPAVEKPEAESKVVWDEGFDWSAVDGSNEKGAWVVDWTVYANRQKSAAGEYYGAGKLGGAPLNIIDALPDGMSYVSGSAKFTLVQNTYDKHTGYYGGNESRTVIADQQLAAGNVSSSGNTVTFSVPTTALGNYAGYAKLTYKTAVKRGKLDTSKNEVKFTNSASAESGSKQFESGSGTVTIKNNVLAKTGAQVDNSNRIKYTILVNESAVDLMRTSDFLELVDTMDAKCTLVPSTLKIYEWGNGAWQPLGDSAYSSKMEQVDGNAGTCTKLTLNVPDEKYLKVEYEVIPSGNPGDKVSLSNTAKLTGVVEGAATDAQTWTVKNVSASAGGNGYGITMTKYDAQQVGAPLEGAEFTLYSVNMDQAETVGVESARTLFGTANTNDDGKISFGAEGHAMSNCTLYQLVESKAPEGYAVAEPKWIMLKGNASDEHYQAALERAKRIVAEVIGDDRKDEIIGDGKKDEIWVYDNRLTGSAVINAKKVLKGGTFKAGQFSFALKDAEGKVLQTATNDAEGNVSFTIECSKAGEYRYTISEVVPEGADGNVKDHITYDTTEHNVTVNVANGDGKLDATVVYDGGTSAPPTFTNKYSATLPAAGGVGTMVTYLIGAVLVSLAAARIHLRRNRAKKGGLSRD